MKLLLPFAWSDHKSPCKTSPHKFAQESLSPHAKFFQEKSPPYFLGGTWGGDTMLYLHIFLISKSFIPNFCGTYYGLSSKTNKPLCF